MLALTLAVTMSAQPNPFHFVVPDGWVDLSPGSPQMNFNGLPSVMKQSLGDPAVVFAAADRAHDSDGFMENVNARISPCWTSLTQSVLERETPALIDGFRKGGFETKLLEQNVYRIADANWGRVVISSKVPALKNVQLKQVLYLIPGGSTCAVVTYTTTAEKYDEYIGVFDAAAQATTGTKEVPALAFLSSVGSGATRGAIIGGVVGLLAMVLRKLFSR